MDIYVFQSKNSLYFIVFVELLVSHSIHSVVYDSHLEVCCSSKKEARLQKFCAELIDKMSPITHS